MLRVLPPAENLSCTRIVPSRYLSVFWAERRLGIRLRRVIFPSSLPMRPHVRLNLIPNLLSPQKTLKKRLGSSLVLHQIRLLTGGKTRNIAFHLVLQQCCKASCMFLFPVSPKLNLDRLCLICSPARQSRTTASSLG